jgi:hypothetical protein
MDKSGYQLSTRMKWGNRLGSLRWNHIFNHAFSANQTIGYTGYDFYLDASFNKYGFHLSSKIDDWYYKMDFLLLKFLDHRLQYGLNYTYHRFSPNNMHASLNQVSYTNAPIYYSHETSAYINDQWTLSPRLTFNAGLRFTNYMQTGPYTQYALDENGFVEDSLVYKKNTIIKTYNRPEPRLSAVYQVNEISSVKASYSINQQFIHLASVGSVSIPTDFWIPSTKNILPQWVTQYTLGYFRNFAGNQYETSVEGYFKQMNDQFEFRNGLFSKTNRNAIEENIVRGKGYAFGMEFFVKRNLGKTTGWISYTISRTFRQFDEINSGKLYPAKYDRIHDLSITLMHQMNDKWSFSAVFIFSTGNAMTLPAGRYIVQGNLVNDYGKVNSFRMPAYHRLDISVNYLLYKKERMESNLNFSVYNVYNRANPYYIYFEAQGNLDSYELSVKPKQISLFPILPSLSWNLRF